MGINRKRVRGAIAINRAEGRTAGKEGAAACGCVVHIPAIISSASCSGCIVRGSDDCFAQIAGTYLNEERTGGGAPPVEGYSRRRVCCTYRVSDLLRSFADFNAAALPRGQASTNDRQKLASRWQNALPSRVRILFL